MFDQKSLQNIKRYMIRREKNDLKRKKKNDNRDQRLNFLHNLFFN